MHIRIDFQNVSNLSSEELLVLAQSQSQFRSFLVDIAFIFEIDYFDYHKRKWTFGRLLHKIKGKRLPIGTI